MAEQMTLISGFYRCQNCGRDVEGVFKTRRWWLCDECWLDIVPSFDGLAETDEQRGQVEAYWSWYGEMERRHPHRRSRSRYLRYSRRRAKSYSQRSTDSYYPFCECGQRRIESSVGEPGLFGGPYLQYCPVCEARHSVESVFMMAGKIMPDRDDEEWLDLMYQSHREAFELGVLPDYWYELAANRLIGGERTDEP